MPRKGLTPTFKTSVSRSSSSESIRVFPINVLYTKASTKHTFRFFICCLSAKHALHPHNVCAILCRSVAFKQIRIQLQERVTPRKNRKHPLRLILEACNVQCSSDSFNRGELGCFRIVSWVSRD